ncbi:MAG: ATP-binding protein [Oligoflexia bacterium]|nr:ATP-binding protein [Oligoflexia bacterium]
MEFKRIIDPIAFITKRSYFLFGPRSTGKTYSIKKNLPKYKNCLYVNLLSADTYLRLSNEPGLLSQMIANHKMVVIDEVQRLPILLNEVHNIIEEKKVKFLLTGSSARRLKREDANLLGGRAGSIHFFPLKFMEINNFDLEKYLLYGGIPRVYDSDEPEVELDSYVNLYLEQEIKLECNLRALLPFNRFIKSAALNNGELLNFSNVASDSEVSASTVREYYSVLEDTLMGFMLEPWTESKKRKAIQTAKFYFFDPGVCHYILGSKHLDRNSNMWGKAFEQFICLELKAYLSYYQRRKKLFFWRSINKQEVDFIIGNDVAIEVKSTKKIEQKHLLGLRALKEEKIIKDFYIISDDKIERVSEEGFKIIHWKKFLQKLWSGEIC